MADKPLHYPEFILSWLSIDEVCLTNAMNTEDAPAPEAP